MSKFLGPIHHWLFNKIRLFEELEGNIITTVHQDLGADLSQITAELTKQYGAPVGNESLEHLIDTDNIHGWLQGKITAAEARQAALITNLIEQFGDDGLNTIKDAYKEQGLSSGTHAKSSYDVASAPALYKALNNYILDGMPCDNVNNITVNESKHLEWKVLDCLHKGYWEQVGGDAAVYYTLREIWITAFIETANPGFTYQFEINRMDNNKVLVHKITIK